MSSSSLLFGRDFGVVTDIRTGPNGNLFVVSLSDGVIYEIFRVRGGGAHGPDDDRGRGHSRRGDDDRRHGCQGLGHMAADFGAIGAGGLGGLRSTCPGTTTGPVSASSGRAIGRPSPSPSAVTGPTDPSDRSPSGPGSSATGS